MHLPRDGGHLVLQAVKPVSSTYTQPSTVASGAECLNGHWFLTLADAREKVEDWRKYCNDDRPIGASGNVPPVVMMIAGGATNPPPDGARKL